MKLKNLVTKLSTIYDDVVTCNEQEKSFNSYQ